MFVRAKKPMMMAKENKNKKKKKEKKRKEKEKNNDKIVSERKTKMVKRI